MNKYIIAGSLAVIAIIIAVVAFYPNTPAAPVTMINYTSPTYGFSFAYPDTYVLAEQTSTDADAITLTRKADLPLTQNSEAAPAIMVNVFADPSSTPLADWLTINGTATNYTLPNTATSETRIAGNIRAIGYLWEGLYQALSVAYERNNSVVIFTGEYNNSTDQIVKDFERIVATVKVQ